MICLFEQISQVGYEYKDVSFQKPTKLIFFNYFIERIPNFYRKVVVLEIRNLRIVQQIMKIR